MLWLNEEISVKSRHITFKSRWISQAESHDCRRQGTESNNVEYHDGREKARTTTRKNKAWQPMIIDVMKDVATTT